MTHVCEEHRLCSGGLFRSLSRFDDQLLLLLPYSNVTDGYGDLRWFGIPRRQRTETNLHRKQRAIVAKSAELTAASHTARARRSVKGGSQRSMFSAHMLGYQHLNRVAHELVPRIAEYVLGLCVG